MSRSQDTNLVVIVGGGVIGLSTAYNLAKLNSESSRVVKIKVVEAVDDLFTAASSRCTGCFHYGFPEPESRQLLPLGKFSFDLWEIEALKADFRAATGYRAQSCFGVGPGNGHGLDKLPDWMQKEPSWDVDTNVLGSYTAMV
ncbi:hypothetical protein VPNG_05035 [Cytospora leucostoma]|uniref:FAD dependent oxidoreductase domain-containing protein n=1 Tax=Cytospora leucostoma TaxID=1230097 RepID=A0A423X7R4_9PEZI|nr:hypothetical protein VPNG_05035 [Cytospora leucostoma]